MSFLKKIKNIFVNILLSGFFCLIVVVLLGGMVAEIQGLTYKSTGYVTKTLTFDEGKVRITVKRDGNLGYIYAENRTPYNVRVTVFPEVTRQMYSVFLDVYYEEDSSGTVKSANIKSQHEKLVAVYRKKQGDLSAVKVEVRIIKTGEISTDQFFW
ncbi:MAG: hypothetical protein DRO67_08675 [Candidatus Asgardarchaeum californiense]|nr:MAG: hypothetical protein DRO67_08675 [Candidatus Asgardarchaeum californiense]